MGSWNVMAVSVRLEHLTKTFGAARAVDDVTLTVEPGELFFLLGPSGCGKTTLLRCIAGFHDPDSGDILIGESAITHLPPHVRDTGMVFQSYALWPHMTVWQNVAFGLEMRRLKRAEIAERVGEALALVRMSERAEAKPNQLSGGQQQRVALARALVVHPQCLLLDEPLSNLDAKLRMEMRVEIRRICKEAGLTAIYVTHDQKEALSIADRLAVMNEGRIEQTGKPLDVYRRPASRFVAHFIGETNFLDGTVIDGTDVRVRTAVGELRTTGIAARTLADGCRVTVSLRPEAVRLGPAPDADVNLLKGSVHDTVYLGEVAQHKVSLSAVAGGGADATMTLSAFELNPRIVALGEQRKVDLWIDPADVVVLER
jgi:iron(III) transport system ATP-binding protein